MTFGPALIDGPAPTRSALLDDPEQQNPMLQFAQMMQGAGLLPPQRPVFTPTAQQQRAAGRDELYALGNNVARAMGANTEWQDPVVARESIREREQARLDKQWLAQAERAKALQGLTSAELASFMLDKSEGFKGSFAQWKIAQQRASGSLPASVQELQMYQMLKESGSPYAEVYGRMIFPKDPAAAAPYNQGFLTNQGAITLDARTGQWMGPNGPLTPEELAAVRQPQYTPSIVGAVAEAGEGGKGRAERMNEQFSYVMNAPQEASVVSSSLQSALDVQKALNEGRLDTGPLAAPLLEYLGIGNETTGAARAAAITSAVGFLNQAKLNPVSNVELQLALSTLFDMKTGERVNKGQIERTVNTLKKLQSRIAERTRTGLNWMKTGDPTSYEMIMSGQADPYYQQFIIPPPGEDGVIDLEP